MLRNVVCIEIEELTTTDLNDTILSLPGEAHIWFAWLFTIFCFLSISRALSLSLHLYISLLPHSLFLSQPSPYLYFCLLSLFLFFNPFPSHFFFRTHFLGYLSLSLTLFPSLLSSLNLLTVGCDGLRQVILKHSLFSSLVIFGPFFFTILKLWLAEPVLAPAVKANFLPPFFCLFVLRNYFEVPLGLNP